LIPFQELAIVEGEGPLSQLAAAPPTRLILLPAETQPVVSECLAPVSDTSTGVPKPLFCSGNRINVEAWRWFSGSHVLASGAEATMIAVRAAVCADYKNYFDQVEEVAIEQLASTYYGWHFPSSPIISKGYCLKHG
jgi:hypothetical protein